MALRTRDKRALAILAGVGVAAAAYFAFTFFVAGDQPVQEAAPVSQPEASPSPEAKEPAKKAKKANKKSPKFAFYGGRDPFVPLVVAGAGGGGSGTSGAVSVVGGAGGSQSSVDRTTIGGHTVVLVDIAGSVVQVTVDGQSYSVTPGESFDGNFELVSVSGGCANFLFGDDAFTLCEPGERK